MFWVEREHFYCARRLFLATWIKHRHCCTNLIAIFIIINLLCKELVIIYLFLFQLRLYNKWCWYFLLLSPLLSAVSWCISLKYISISTVIVFWKNRTLYKVKGSLSHTVCICFSYHYTMESYAYPNQSDTNINICNTFTKSWTLSFKLHIAGVCGFYKASCCFHDHWPWIIVKCSVRFPLTLIFPVSGDSAA